jgi:4-amino-4-deoxy-L-arabinose transferase-like glycosyltransferase
MDWNQQQCNVPSDDALHLARWPSAVLTALGVIPIFLLGWQLRLRSLAYPAALLYALHPVILLNGRRAMMEGSLMLATLLIMSWLLAMIIAEHSATASGFVRRLPPAVRYAVLGVLVGLVLAAKQTGLVVAGAALIAALMTSLLRDRSWRPVALVGLAALIAVLTWFALSPAYWNDPLGALQATITARTDLLASQSKGTPLAYTTLSQRLQGIITEPFLSAPQYYESPSWAGLIDAQIAAYQQSSIHGWDWGPLVGALLTALAGFGLLALLFDALHRDLVALAILIWAGATILASLAIPLDWQRYYLPLLLVAITLAAEGLGRVLVRRMSEEKHPVLAGSDAPGV